MSNIKIQFQKLFSEQNIFDSQYHDFSFEYQKFNSSILNTNQVCLVGRDSFRHFLKEIDLPLVNYYDPLDQENTNQIFDNTEILNKNKEREIFNTKQENYLMLNRVLKNMDENDIVFLSQECFNLIRQKFGNYQLIKKVLYFAEQQIKVELYNPIISLLILDNENLLNKNINEQNCQSFIHKIQISRLMNRRDLLTIIRELVYNKYEKNDQDLEDELLFIIDEPELDRLTYFKLIKEKLEGVEIEDKNLQCYDLNENQIIVFYFRNLQNPFKFNQKLIKQQTISLLNQQTFSCYQCEKNLHYDQAYCCYCKTIFCSKACHREVRNSHNCFNNMCQECNLKMISSDLGSIRLCRCGEILCCNRCLDQHQLKFRCNQEDLVVYKDKSEINEGKTGFSNIGNTCYMNSALQCLLHYDIIQEKFLLEQIENDANMDNPLGTKGKLLKEFTYLVREYFKTQKTHLNLGRFKHTLTDFLSTFEGYQQHDSQEFLSQLMDQLHEDLNKILKKPLTTNIEAKKNDSIEQTARQSWIVFLKRNYSFFINMFYGQYKSIVECPKCDNNSMTFDPFQLISLSIPEQSKVKYQIYFINQNNYRSNIKVMMKISSNHKFNDFKIDDIKNKVCEKLQQDPNTCIVTNLDFQGHPRIYSDHQNVSNIIEPRSSSYQHPSILVYQFSQQELSRMIGQWNYIYLKVDNENQDPDNSQYQRYRYNYYQKDTKIYTLFSIVNENTTIQELYQIVFQKLFYATSIASTYKDKNLDGKSLGQLWETIINKIKDKIFFYIKLNDKKLDSNDSTKLYQLHDLKHKIKIEIFIYSDKKTTTEFNYNHFISVENIDDDGDQLKLESVDLKEFKDSYSLEFLLKTLGQKEVLDEENAWYCNKCKKHVRAIKTLSLYKIPKYLIFHLKKLKINQNKIPMITFPIENLDMKDYVISQSSTQNYNVQPEEFYTEQDIQSYQKNNQSLTVLPIDNSTGQQQIYDLCGVVNHFGSQNFGHYTAYCKLKNGQWGNFDDSKVDEISSEEVVTQAAYILFYRRRDQQFIQKKQFFQFQQQNI